MKLNVITLGFLLSLISLTVIGQTNTAPAVPNTESITFIEFETPSYDWGIIEQGEKVRFTYYFTNTGDEPLIISNAKGSCGCTVPQWPTAPVMPGETDKIVVEFNSKGKKGKQSKRVTITANTDPVQTFLTIKGEIIVPANEIPKETDLIEEAVTPELDFADTHDHNLEKPSTKDCFAIFPNPTTDVLKLDLKDYNGKSADISIFDAKGKMLASRQLEEVQSNIETFQVSDYAPGTYYVRLQVDTEAPNTRCFVVAK